MADFAQHAACVSSVRMLFTLIMMAAHLPIVVEKVIPDVQIA